MTKEETLAYIKAYMDGDISVSNIIPLRSVLESAIKYISEPSLTSNLDEAARMYSERSRFHWPNQVKPVYDAFRAGAEWMMEHGVSVDAYVVPYDDGLGLNMPDEDILSGIFKDGDKVVVQIRKK